MTDPKFLEANAAKLAGEPRTATECEQSVKEMNFKSLYASPLPDWVKRLQESKAKPDTDWHAEAQMYAECLGRVKAFCERQPHREKQLCQCNECEAKRRVLRIIADNLK